MSDQDNPGIYVTQELCAAYRQTLEEKFKTTEEKIEALRNLFIGAISLSTVIISLVMYLLSLG